MINKNVIITGSNRGIGKSCVEEFAQNGANIWAHARKKTDDFEAFIQETAEKNKVWIKPLYFDFGNIEELRSAIKEVLKTKEPIDALVNCAGIGAGGIFAMTPIAKIKEVFEINLFAQMEITQLVLKVMMRQKSGSVVNIASIAGLDLKPGNSAYGVAKAALIAWTKTLAAECAAMGVRVNAVAPGITDTDMAQQMQSSAAEEMVGASAMKRMAKPEEIARVALFLASDKASFVNGQTIRVDGGAA